MYARLSKYKTQKDYEKLMAAVRTRPLVIFDLETTGIRRAEDRILSFSAVKCRYEGNRFVEYGVMDVLIDPEFPIPWSITKINHITNEMVEGRGTERDVLPSIREFLGEEPVLCGYNSHTFDIPFLNATYLRVFGEPLAPYFDFDVFRAAKDLLDLRSYKLEEVATALACHFDLRFHDSISDVRATMRVLNLLLPDYKNAGGYTDEYLPSDKVRLVVMNCNHYYKGHQVNRIYISTNPYTKSFYDIYKGEWKSDLSFADMDALRADTLKKYNCADERDLVRIFTAGKAV